SVSMVGKVIDISTSSRWRRCWRSRRRGVGCAAARGEFVQEVAGARGGGVGPGAREGETGSVLDGLAVFVERVGVGGVGGGEVEAGILRALLLGVHAGEGVNGALHVGGVLGDPALRGELGGVFHAARLDDAGAS